MGRGVGGRGRRRRCDFIFGGCGEVNGRGGWWREMGEDSKDEELDCVLVDGLGSCISMGRGNEYDDDHGVSRTHVHRARTSSRQPKQAGHTFGI